MSRSKQGAKTGRREKHLARQAALREAKKLRKKRAAIHGAMTEAARLKRSKKKGMADFEHNMMALGFRGKYRYSGRLSPGDVVDKYEART
jgi:hypothetical protein